MTQQAKFQGVMIAGVFGAAWAEWGASGLSSTPSQVVGIAGLVAGAGIVAGSIRLRRTGTDSSTSMFRSPVFRAVVGIEAVALAAGAIILSSTGHKGYIAAWFAIVVGVHFLALGRVFFARYFALGLALIAGGVAAALVGVLGGGNDAIESTAGLTAAASLLLTGARGVAEARS